MKRFRSIHEELEYYSRWTSHSERLEYFRLLEQRLGDRWSDIPEWAHGPSKHLWCPGMSRETLEHLRDMVRGWLLKDGILRPDSLRFSFDSDQQTTREKQEAWEMRAMSQEDLRATHLYSVILKPFFFLPSSCQS